MSTRTRYRIDERPTSGRRPVAITGHNGEIVLTTFNEQLAAAQVIQAQMLLGATREEAEAVAAEIILQRRKAQKWFDEK